VKAATTGARPAEEAWWDTPPRGDLASLLAAHLTTPQAAEAPMLLLGQPGAGKSSLTRVLAARLPAADFLVVRVALREVSTEAPIQDQVEQAIRAAIGENVAWPDLARDAGGAMPVILLDGFDELLQATGVHQSDYLQRVAAFQQREATLGRPVAVMVTSRVAVADRARLPAGGLAVRLEPFDEDQVARWLEIWNSANAARLAQAGRRTLPLPVVRRFPDLAEQPLLLLMLALYDAAGNALQDGGETFDTGQLYERLLANFAEREARRVHPGHSDAEMPALVEQELLRLSVVAFAMFHRLRLWVTEQELDHDLAGLGLRPARSAGAADFRAPLTAGQEAVGRFFFIQRAQAVRDGKTLQAYEFLHATFGEYLVARLTVQALRDAVARSSAGTLALRADRADDELLQSLLGFTPLTARTTVLPFVTALLDGPDRAANRVWLVSRLRTALTRPEYVPRAYQPVEKRIDFWMATYSFNLTLLALACGEPLRASELFVHATDPAGWLRTAALQWRAAVPGGMWLGALEEIEVTRGWTEHGQRDMTLVAGVRDSIAQEVELPWSHVNGPVWEWTSFVRFDSFPEALRSMDLSSNLSDDLLRHAVEPLMRAMPESITNLAHHAPTDVESVAHSLVHLWTTSALDQDPEQVLRAYQRAVVAVTGQKWLTSTTAMEPMASTAGVILRCLHVDATRLNPGDVVGLIWEIYLSVPFVPDAELRLLALECLLGETMPAFAPRDDLVKHTLSGLTNEIRRWPATWALRLLAVLSRASDIDGFGEAVGEIDQLLASPSVVAELRGDPGLAERVAAARGRLDRTPDGPVS